MDKIHAMMFIEILTSYSVRVCVGDTISFKAIVTILSKAEQQWIFQFLIIWCGNIGVCDGKLWAFEGDLMGITIISN